MYSHFSYLLTASHKHLSTQAYVVVTFSLLLTFFCWIRLFLDPENKIRQLAQASSHIMLLITFTTWKCTHKTEVYYELNIAGSEYCMEEHFFFFFSSFEFFFFFCIMYVCMLNISTVHSKEFFAKRMCCIMCTFCEQFSINLKFWHFEVERKYSF